MTIKPSKIVNASLQDVGIFPLFSLKNSRVGAQSFDQASHL
jgi:hypothetical protein